MAIQLTQKERMLLEDQKKHEQVCIDKYNSYASQAQDKELKQLFHNYAQQEQQHLDSINQMLNGQIPNMNQQGQQGFSMQINCPQIQQTQQTQQTQQKQQMAQNQQSNKVSSLNITIQCGNAKQIDERLCNDILMTEKYVSGAYDTAIFEFNDTNMRQTLNHIQKEEQEHGEGIFNYMKSKGMYNVQQ